MNDRERQKPASPARRYFLVQSGLVTAGTAAMAAPLVANTLEDPQGPRRTGCADLAPPMKEVNGKVAFISGGSNANPSKTYEIEKTCIRRERFSPPMRRYREGGKVTRS